ncbi:kanadaptin-like [Scleropages formosus]|uniref:Kanadaptin-like n=1 Tax=Scleropages formosus TaxID=113540 RepID=A0A0N8K1M1_SCLFO|nr:kanadaptin-like [Scleropages formosus]
MADMSSTGGMETEVEGKLEVGAETEADESSRDAEGLEAAGARAEPAHEAAAKAVGEETRDSSARPKVRLPAKPPAAPGACPPLPYAEPPWGGAPPSPYSFEVLKNGTIVDTVPLEGRSFTVVGRLPACDVPLEHPSVSRYHTVVQYRARPLEHAGLYAFDMGSTHGTFVNKSRLPPKTYVRLHVGHVLRFGGSTRLFVLQGPETDEEAESELTVTELRERARKQREALEKRMMGDGSDDEGGEEEEEEEEEGGGGKEGGGGARSSSEDAGCSWGMGEDRLRGSGSLRSSHIDLPRFLEDQEAAYLKDPKKALQGFYDREGEELEFEYEDKGHGTWTCRVRLPVDDALGRQLVAEVTHSGKKKEAAIQCSLEACRILEARGLLRQEAVSRKRKKKNWEEEDFYDSDDDTFLDRTGVVERKREERMKRAGKIEERPETYNSLVERLAEVEKELLETEKKLRSSVKGDEQPSTEDPLDAFMSAVRSQGPLDSVARRKLHLRMAELRKEGQRLRKLVELTRPAQLPPLQTSPGRQPTEPVKAKKPSLPMFGAMKGGSKFKLKTGTIGKLPPKRPSLPPELFSMKDLPPGGEEEEEEEEETESEETKDPSTVQEEHSVPTQRTESQPHAAAGRRKQERLAPDEGEQSGLRDGGSSTSPTGPASEVKMTQSSAKTKEKKKVYGPSRVGTAVKGRCPSSCPANTNTLVLRHNTLFSCSFSHQPPATLSAQYPKDDPDYCVWMPPAGKHTGHWVKW